MPLYCAPKSQKPNTGLTGKAGSVTGRTAGKWHFISEVVLILMLQQIEATLYHLICAFGRPIYRGVLGIIVSFVFFVCVFHNSEGSIVTAFRLDVEILDGSPESLEEFEDSMRGLLTSVINSGSLGGIPIVDGDPDVDPPQVIQDPTTTTGPPPTNRRLREYLRAVCTIKK